MRNMRCTFVLVLVFLAWNANGQENYILYDLPEKVTQKAKEYVDHYIAGNGPTKFIAELNKSDDGSYVVFIIIDDFETEKTPNILYKEVIKKTTRMVRLGEGVLLPLITQEDLLFAFFGDAPPRKPGGPKGKKKVVLTHESYSISFELDGRIID